MAVLEGMRIFARKNGIEGMDGYNSNRMAIVEIPSCLWFGSQYFVKKEAYLYI